MTERRCTETVLFNNPQTRSVCVRYLYIVCSNMYLKKISYKNLQTIFVITSVFSGVLSAVKQGHPYLRDMELTALGFSCSINYSGPVVLWRWINIV